MKPLKMCYHNTKNDKTGTRAFNPRAKTTDNSLTNSGKGKEKNLQLSQ